MGLLRRFQPVLPRPSLITIYKTFIRSQLDYADVIYDQAHNSSFHEKLKSFWYNARLTTAGAIRGTCSEKTIPRFWVRIYKIEMLVYKILNAKSPSYLFDLISDVNRVHETKHSNNIPAIHVKHDFFKDSFLLSTVWVEQTSLKN